MSVRPCKHNWSSWISKANGRAAPGGDIALARPWVRECGLCRGREFLSLRTGDHPRDDHLARGWFIPALQNAP